MIWVELAVVLIAIAIGARLGGIAIGFAGGLGVLALALLGVKPGAMPLDVIVIMMAVITTSAALQAAGGMDYLIQLAGRVLRHHPKQLVFLAPLVTWLLTFTTGTGMSAFAAFPIITEVAKETDIRPARPLSLAAIASMTAIVASPMSAAVVFFSSLLNGTGSHVDYLGILAVTIPSTLVGLLATAGIMLLIDKARGALTLSSFKRESSGEYAADTSKAAPAEPEPPIDRRAKISVLIFVASLVVVIAYAILTSSSLGLVKNPLMNNQAAIIAIMLTAGAAIVMFCKRNVNEILSTSTFKSGGSSYVCCLGVAWLGTTFITANQDSIVAALSGILNVAPWLLAVVLVIASSLLYSQAATAKALMPLALSLVAPSAAVATFPAVAGFFLLPTYPTVVGTVAIDDTGTTKIGNFVFNHSFIIPGLINMTITVAVGFMMARLIL